MSAQAGNLPYPLADCDDAWVRVSVQSSAGAFLCVWELCSGCRGWTKAQETKMKTVGMKPYFFTKRSGIGSVPVYDSKSLSVKI